MFMQHSVPLYGSHGLVYVLVHPCRQHYHHPACLGPSPQTVTPERLIKCTSDPFLLIPQVVSVEFMGPQQPNGEMAQWGNMPQRGNGPKGKVWVHTRKCPDWGLNPGPPGYILGALTTELYGPEYRVLASHSYQLCQIAYPTHKTQPSLLTPENHHHLHSDN